MYLAVRKGILLLLIVTTLPLRGEEEKADSNKPEFEQLIGYATGELIEILGPPEIVYPFRGDREEEDGVVLYYSEHIYFFIFQNKVWQVRGDHRFEGTLWGVKIGTPKESLIEKLGPPLYSDEDSIIYIVKERGYPTKLRLFFIDEKVDDLYLYRGDF